MYWVINTGQCYGAVEQDWVSPAPDDAITLYSDTGIPEAPVIADKAFLRETVLFYGYPLGDGLKNRLDTIQDIQTEYAPQLAALQAAKAGADMRDDTDEVAAVKTEYAALLQEMNDKIQAVPNDETL